jgi:hypothetical protein
MTVNESIAFAETLLPGQAALEGESDPRWQAIIAIGDFIETDPEAVWTFITRWGASDDEDLRTAIATCLLEHLLEHHFDLFIDRVERTSAARPSFGQTVMSCWKFGQSDETERSARLDRLRASIRNSSEG